jgi:hypothetical protein
MDESSCPICHGSAIRTSSLRVGLWNVQCGICGEYSIDRVLGISLEKRSFDRPEDQDFVPYLTAYIRQHKGDNPGINRQNWKALAEGIRSTSVVTKLEKLLRLIIDRSPFVGAPVRIVGDSEGMRIPSTLVRLLAGFGKSSKPLRCPACKKAIQELRTGL